MLPRALALQLAAQSDGVADALAAGETCEADQRADELRDAVLAAVNGGRVPGPFQEELVASVNGLAERIGCDEAPAEPPPPPPATTAPATTAEEEPATTETGTTTQTEEPVETETVVEPPPPVETTTPETETETETEPPPPTDTATVTDPGDDG